MISRLLNELEIFQIIVISGFDQPVFRIMHL